MTIRPLQEHRHPEGPRAIGYLRTDLSRDRQPRHTDAIRRLARHRGHTLIYIVRLHRDAVPDPVGHVLEIVRATGTDAVIVPDLAHIDNRPGFVCDTCDLITVCPDQLWMKTCVDSRIAPQSTRMPGNRHSEPVRRLRIPDAHRIMQEHKTCNPLACPRKAAGFARLAETGRLVPATRSPRERAAARGLSYPSADTAPPTTGPPITLLRRLLTGLADA